MRIQTANIRATLALIGVLLALMLASGRTHAQSLPKPGTEAAPQAVPGFWDPRRRPDRPDLSRLTVIRFLTETDYPPFNFTGPDGNPAGFNVDLARLLCEEPAMAPTFLPSRYSGRTSGITASRRDTNRAGAR